MKPESPTARVPSALGWTVVFAAVLAQLPALRAWFAQDDFDFLARAVGTLATPDWPIRPLTTVWSWKLLYPIFGLQAAPYHAIALLGFALIALLVLRVGARLGLGGVGQAVAALWIIATPFALRPISWASASGEVWAALFALLALELWSREGSSRRPWPVAAGACVLLSLSAKEAGLILPLLMALTVSWWPPREANALRRGRGLVLGISALAAALTAWLVARAFGAGDLQAYALGGPAVLLDNLRLAGAWILTPFAGRPLPPASWMWALGLVFWLAWALDAAWRWRAGDRGVAFAAILGLGSLFPVLPLAQHFESYYLLLATCGVAWWMGSLAQRLLPRRTRNPRLFVLLMVLVTAATLWRNESAMSARLADGRLADPILRRGAIALETRRLLSQVPDLESVPMIAVLQATRIHLPNDVEIPENSSVILSTPVFEAMRGERGLGLLVAEGVPTRWTTHLDNLPLDTLVLLDSGDEQLRILGPLENARMYSALIAVAAGQHARASHDLWQVIGKLGTEIQFAFEPQNLPIAAAELDSQAEPFVRYLEAENQPSSMRILRLFAQLYQAIRGRPLLDEDWMVPQRAPRAGD